MLWIYIMLYSLSSHTQNFTHLGEFGHIICKLTTKHFQTKPSHVLLQIFYVQIHPNAWNFVFVMIHNKINVNPWHWYGIGVDLGNYGELWYVYLQTFLISMRATMFPVLLIVCTTLILVSKQNQLYHNKVHLMSFKMHTMNIFWRER